jgi:LAO/AO transport system kinase
MDRLSREPNSFIRPSPAGETMGGVARKTREAMILCEAAGFDVMIVETMGVGQGETALRSMVDFFLLLVLPGAGDELQGIKRGIMEMADAVFINKADGDNLQRAEFARGEYSLAMGYMAPATPGWKSPVVMGSGLHGFGIAEMWEMIERFYAELKPKGIIEEQRHQQTLNWLKDLVQEELASRFFRDDAMRNRMKALETALLKGQITPPAAVKQLFEGESCSKK